MRFCIRRRSARSDILVQSSFGLAEALKAELLACVEAYLEWLAMACEYEYVELLCIVGAEEVESIDNTARAAGRWMQGSEIWFRGV